MVASVPTSHRTKAKVQKKRLRYDSLEWNTAWKVPKYSGKYGRAEMAQNDTIAVASLITTSRILTPEY